MSHPSHLKIAFALFALTGCTAAAPTNGVASQVSVVATDLGPAHSIAPMASEGHETKPQPMPKVEVASVASSTADMDMPGMTSSPVQHVHDGHNDAHGTGTVNSVNAAQHSINISHKPISSIGWPAMTMDFKAAPAVDLSQIKPGQAVNFTIEQGKDGMYEVQALSPAAAPK